MKVWSTLYNSELKLKHRVCFITSQDVVYGKLETLSLGTGLQYHDTTEGRMSVPRPFNPFSDHIGLCCILTVYI